MKEKDADARAREQEKARKRDAAALESLAEVLADYEDAMTPVVYGWSWSSRCARDSFVNCAFPMAGACVNHGDKEVKA